MSTMTFDDLMAFVGADYAVAAQSTTGGREPRNRTQQRVVRYRDGIRTHIASRSFPCSQLKQGGGNDHKGQPYGAECCLGFMPIVMYDE